jgi:hypothetical protein
LKGNRLEMDSHFSLGFNLNRPMQVIRVIPVGPHHSINVNLHFLDSLSDWSRLATHFLEHSRATETERLNGARFIQKQSGDAESTRALADRSEME